MVKKFLITALCSVFLYLPVANYAQDMDNNDLEGKKDNPVISDEEDLNNKGNEWGHRESNKKPDKKKIEDKILERSKEKKKKENPNKPSKEKENEISPETVNNINDNNPGILSDENGLLYVDDASYKYRRIPEIKIPKEISAAEEQIEKEESERNNKLNNINQKDEKKGLFSLSRGASDVIAKGILILIVIVIIVLYRVRAKDKRSSVLRRFPKG